MKKLILLFLLAPSIAFATPWICPSSRVNDQSTILYRQSRPKPGLNETFYDSVYSTCYQRIATDTSATGAAFVPLYSEMQAWNADQSRIWLANGVVINSPSYAKYRVVSGGGGINFRWSPWYPDTGYYAGGPSTREFKGINIRNDATFTIHDFGATYHQGISNQTANPQEQHDVSPNGWILTAGFLRTARKDTLGVSVSATLNSNILNITSGNADSLVDNSEIYDYVSGFPDHTTFIKLSGTQLQTSSNWQAASGNYTVFASNSRIFGYNVARDVTTSTIPGFSPHCSGGAEDLFASPKGDYLLVHWGIAGAQPGNDYTTPLCGLTSFDTTMVYKGKVASGRTHGSVGVDGNGKQWYIAGCNGTDGPPTGGPTGVSVYKYRIPDGQDLYNAQSHVENDSTVIGLCTWNLNGIHVSATAPGVNWAIVSGDYCGTGSNCAGCGGVTSREPMQNEIVKVYYNSRISSPILERLADARSNEHAILCSACAPSGYWAQPHATISRDGTKVIWGSNWTGSGDDSGAVCHIEPYVMDINRTGRNQTLVDMPVNTWRRITAPRVLKYDGTGGGAADTIAPYRVYSSVKFAPELGAMISFGGGSDGASQGYANDIFTYTTYDSLWRQVTYPDSVNKYPQAMARRAGTANQDSIVNGPYSVRDLYNVKGGMMGSTADSLYWHPVANAMASEFQPTPGGTRNHRPMSAHQAMMQMWDSRNRTFNLVSGAAGLYQQHPPPDSTCPGESTFTITCTWTNGSNILRSNHLFGPIPRSGNGNTYPASPRSVAGMVVSGPGLSNANHDYSARDTTFSVTTITSDSTITMSRNANATSQAGGEPATFGYSVPGQSYFIWMAKQSWKYKFYHPVNAWSYIDPSTGPTKGTQGNWAFIDTFPDLVQCCGQYQYDPVNKKGVASSHGIAQLGGGTQTYTPGWVWTVDTSGVWTRKARIPTDGKHSPYYVTSIYNRKRGTIVWYPASSDTTMWEYNVATDTFSDINPLRDPVNGKPNLGDSNIAYDSKTSKLFVHGYNGNNGSYVPSWVYSDSTNQWTKLSVTSYNSNGSQSNAGEPDGAGVRDRDMHFDFDPTNNVFIMIRHNGQVNYSGSGQQAVTAGPTAEVWAFKLTPGDGRLFEPITPSAPGGGGGGCIAPTGL